ncbi:hypothetical protein CAJAP_11192 [Camponotus japonicus]
MKDKKTSKSDSKNPRGPK